MSFDDKSWSDGFSKVVRSSFWIYATNFLNNAFGFIFWLLISFIAGPSIVGIISAISSLANFFAGILNLGVPVGLIRWLGHSIGSGKTDEAQKFFWSGLLFLITLIVPVSLVLGFMGYIGLSFSRYSPLTLVFTSMFLIFSLKVVVTSLYIGYMKTFPYFLSTLIGQILRIVVGVLLVLIGFGWIGAAIGYLMISLTMTLVGIFYIAELIGFTPSFSTKHLLQLLKAGIPSWIPNVIVTIGQQLAVISVFIMIGAAETGTFYVAFTIGSFVIGIALAVQQIMFPYLSGLTDGRKRAAWNSVRVGLAFTMPLVVGVGLFPEYILGLLGPSYTVAWLELEIIMFSSLLLVFTSAVNNLCYAYEKYHYVLLIGLAMSIPRLILYVFLTPIWGSTGTALSLAIGSVTGILTALTIAPKIGLNFNWQALTSIFIAPLATGIPLGLLFKLFIPKLWIVGLSATIILNYIILMKLKIIAKNDIVEIGKAIIPKKYQPTIYDLAKPLIDLIYG